MLSLCNYILFWLQLQKRGKVNVGKTRKSKKKVKEELMRSIIVVRALTFQTISEVTKSLHHIIFLLLW